MRTLAFVGLLAAVALSASDAGAQGSLASQWTPAATYLNDPAHEAQATRARAELDAHGIRSVTTCSLGCTLSVEGRRWGEALVLLRQIIAREHLDIAELPAATS